MIFVTVGTQLAFDRLIEQVDKWAHVNPSVDVFSQIGPSGFQPSHIQYKDFISPQEAESFIKNAELIVSHAGMGTILTALRYQKPILILPRLASLGEHRNDHQLATAKWLGNRGGVHVAWNVEELSSLLNERAGFESGSQISDRASPLLIAKLREFIFNEKME